MRLLQIGFTHKNAPVEVRETLARLEPRSVLEAARAQGCSEAVALSTCNRFELYLCPGADPAASAAALIGRLEDLAGRALSEFCEERSGPEAVAHLFCVASGLDSLVVGETEILGQVKTAYEAARARGMTAKRLNVLFQRALFVGKRARRLTAIAAGPTSAASVAVQLAGAVRGGLSASEVLVMGAGRMAEQACRHFLCRQVRGLSVANRTRERAEALAEALSGGPVAVRVLPWEGIAEALAVADVVLASTGADRPVLSRDLVAAARGRRAGRALFIIDIAMPRAVEESVGGLEGVSLYRLEDLERIVRENLSSRQGEIEKARLFADRKAAEFWAWAESAARGQERSLSHAGAG